MTTHRALALLALACLLGCETPPTSNPIQREALRTYETHMLRNEAGDCLGFVWLPPLPLYGDAGPNPERHVALPTRLVGHLSGGDWGRVSFTPAVGRVSGAEARSTCDQGFEIVYLGADEGYEIKAHALVARDVTSDPRYPRYEVELQDEILEVDGHARWRVEELPHAHLDPAYYELRPNVPLAVGAPQCLTSDPGGWVSVQECDGRPEQAWGID